MKKLIQRKLFTKGSNPKLATVKTDKITPQLLNLLKIKARAQGITLKQALQNEGLLEKAQKFAQERLLQNKGIQRVSSFLGRDSETAMDVYDDWAYILVHAKEIHYRSGLFYVDLLKNKIPESDIYVERDFNSLINHKGTITFPPDFIIEATNRLIEKDYWTAGDLPDIYLKLMRVIPDSDLKKTIVNKLNENIGAKLKKKVFENTFQDMVKRKDTEAVEVICNWRHPLGEVYLSLYIKFCGITELKKDIIRYIKLSGVKVGDFSSGFYSALLESDIPKQDKKYFLQFLIKEINPNLFGANKLLKYELEKNFNNSGLGISILNDIENNNYRNVMKRW